MRIWLCMVEHEVPTAVIWCVVCVRACVRACVCTLYTKFDRLIVCKFHMFIIQAQG